MKNPFKNREPMTPAQKKIAAAIACIVLIVVASVSFDLLLGSRDNPAADAPVIVQTAETTPQSEEEGEESAAQDEGDAAADEQTLASIAAGQSLDAGDLAILNNTDREVGEECGALASSLRTFLMASGLSYSGTQFSIVDFTSSADTGAATFFLTSDLAGAQYIMAQRSSADVDFQISTATDEVGFTALMDQALAGNAAATSEAPAENGTADAGAEAAANAPTDVAEAGVATEGGM